jgi:hypothetical protein
MQYNKGKFGSKNQPNYKFAKKVVNDYNSVIPSYFDTSTPLPLVPQQGKFRKTVSTSKKAIRHISPPDPNLTNQSASDLDLSSTQLQGRYCSNQARESSQPDTPNLSQSFKVYVPSSPAMTGNNMHSKEVEGLAPSAKSMNVMPKASYI